MTDRHPDLPATTAPLTLSQEEAARFVGVSAKTLKRLADRGEPVGRITLCTRRVVFLRAHLEAWLTSKLPTPTTL
jgi:DNA-binding XRE family transcriptional regulator